MSIGFFGDVKWDKKQPLPLLPQCGQCKLDQGCSSPRMPTSGQGKRKIMLVAESPGENEDREGVQLVGNSGMELVRILNDLGVNMRRDCWLENTISCHPPDDRNPTDKEILHCQPHLLNAIKKLQPEMIIPLGKFALKSLIPLFWKSGEVEDVGEWSGQRIPSVKFGGIWICPTYHPSFLLHSREPVGELIVRQNLKAAFKLKGRPWNGNPPNYESQVQVVSNPTTAAKMIRSLISSNPAAVDIETSTKKCDGSHAEILCCSISDGKTTIAYPWIGEAVEATREFLISDTPKIGAMKGFESRWFKKKLGVRVRNWIWDVVLVGHFLNCSASCSVKFQSFTLLGAPDYDSWIKPYMSSAGDDNSPNRLNTLDPVLVQKYCGLDSLLEWKIAEKQWRILHDQEKRKTVRCTYL